MTCVMNIFLNFWQDKVDNVSRRNRKILRHRKLRRIRHAFTRLSRLCREYALGDRPGTRPFFGRERLPSSQISLAKRALVPADLIPLLQFPQYHACF